MGAGTQRGEQEQTTRYPGKTFRGVSTLGSLSTLVDVASSACGKDFFQINISVLIQ